MDGYFWNSSNWLHWRRGRDSVFRLTSFAAEPQTPSATAPVRLFESRKICANGIFYKLTRINFYRIQYLYGGERGIRSFVSLCKLAAEPQTPSATAPVRLFKSRKICTNGIFYKAYPHQWLPYSVSLWRRGRDLNPRDRYYLSTRFRVERFQPLSHLSRLFNHFIYWI